MKLEKQYSEPFPTIETFAKKKDYDYVSYRLLLDKRIDIFAGCFALKNGCIIPIDGDTYSLSEKVVASEEWSIPEEGIQTGLTIIVI